MPEPRFLLVLAATIVATAHGAEAPVDGLYRTTDAPSAPLVRTLDGVELRLGERQQQARASKVTSQDNANSAFMLELSIPLDPALERNRYVLVLEGAAYAQSGWGSSDQKVSSLWFPINGDQRATAAARLFGIPVTYRQHPGYRLRVSFTPDKPSFSPGEEATVTLRIVNMGTEPIAFMKGGRNRAARDNQYQFSAYRGGQPVPDIGNSGHAGGLAVSVILQPGAVFEDRISLAKWFSFTEPGHYDLHGAYYLAFVKPERMAFETIWEDYVGADFRITVK